MMVIQVQKPEKYHPTFVTQYTMSCKPNESVPRTTMWNYKLAHVVGWPCSEAGAISLPCRPAATAEQFLADHGIDHLLAIERSSRYIPAMALAATLGKAAPPAQPKWLCSFSGRRFAEIC